MCDLKNGVLFIGALFVVVSMITTSTSVAVFSTFESHAASCERRHAETLLVTPPLEKGVAIDPFGVLPECRTFVNPSFRLASRIFMTVQIVIWILLILCSVLLIIGAAKRRASLIFPWVVLVLLVMGSIIYDLATGGHKYGITSTVIASTVLIGCAVCLSVVLLFIKSLKSNRCNSLVTEPVTSIFMSGSAVPRFGKASAKPGLVQKPVSPSVRGAALAAADDLPPDYASAVARGSNANVENNSQTSTCEKLPSGLGVLR